jgi:hypothetical protein
MVSYISEWDLHGAALRLATSSLCHKGEIYIPDKGGPHVYIRMDSHRCSAATTTRSLRQGRTYTQGHGIHVYIRMGFTRCSGQDYHRQLQLAEECHFASAYIVGIHIGSAAIITGASPATRGEIYVQGHGIHVYNRMGFTRH